MGKPFLSICVLSYNRPETLGRLLMSIDYKNQEDIEVVICEDKSPRREEIRRIVEEYKTKPTPPVIYCENEKNLGFDGNIRECVRRSSGKWIMLMGDDDAFVPGVLEKFVLFLKKHSDLGYVLRSYRTVFNDGSIEMFRYYENDKFFTQGKESYLELFRKSVFVSGFTIRREFVLPHLINLFDGTLLFQLYLVGEVTLKYPSAYMNEPLTEQYERELSPFFGNSDAEKKLYTPGTVTIDNSINFMTGFSKITEYIDRKHGLDSTALIKKDISKYSYPVLSVQRERGVRTFFLYVKKLNALGFNCTPYYYIYVLSLVLFGKKFCDGAIKFIKNVLGRTPKL